ncbi:MAG TPA: glycosyltransferase 87 family protein [Candidatus Sulfotelmatobacter sp.]|nr:glycosyltransferase 87 family protein [Candidatus Sulfotelmatobacter sp.]
MNFNAIRAVAGAYGAQTLRYYPLLFAVLFLLYLAGVWLVWSGGQRVAIAAVGLGLLFRLLLLPTPVVLSSDLYRYLWDGRVQLAGINPYRHAPQDEALAGLRDPEIHPRINRPWAPTVYPPGAEMLFAGLAWIAPGRIGALRLFLILCDLATMLVLVRLLRRLGLPEGRVAVYAWAPLPIFEFAQSGHIDAALIPLVLLALLCRIEGRTASAGFLLGAATLLKLYPAALLPVLWKRRDARLPLAFAAAMLAGYVPYAWGVKGKVAGFLPTYFARFEDFNVGLRSFLTEDIGLTGDGARAAAMAILAAGLALTILCIGRRRPDTPAGIARAASAAVGAYLLLVPATMHPWYVAWLVPFLAIVPGVGWWYFSAAVALSYTGYAVDPHQVPLWARCAEYLPTYALVFLGIRAPGGRPTWALATALRTKASP